MGGPGGGMQGGPRGGGMGMPGGSKPSESSYDYDKQQQKYDKAIAKILTEQQYEGYQKIKPQFASQRRVREFLLGGQQFLGQASMGMPGGPGSRSKDIKYAGATELTAQTRLPPALFCSKTLSCSHFPLEKPLPSSQRMGSCVESSFSPISTGSKCQRLATGCWGLAQSGVGGPLRGSSITY